MGRLVLYLTAYIPLLIITIIFSYVGYLHKAKKYKRIFYKTLRKEGVPRKAAKVLSAQIKILKFREILKYGNIRSIL